MKRYHSSWDVSRDRMCGTFKDPDKDTSPLSSFLFKPLVPLPILTFRVNEFFSVWVCGIYSPRLSKETQIPGVL